MSETLAAKVNKDMLLAEKEEVLKEEKESTVLEINETQDPPQSYNGGSRQDTRHTASTLEPESKRKLPVMRALLWKNLTLKKKRWKSTCCEILLPAVLLVSILLLKTLTDVEVTPEGWEEKSFQSVRAESQDSSFTINNFGELFFEDDIGRLCLAHSGKDREETALFEFVDFISDNFNTNFSESIFLVGSGSESELEGYLLSQDYGETFDENTPECQGAIIFTKIDFEKAQFEYTIRGDTDFNVFQIAAVDSNEEEVAFRVNIFTGEDKANTYLFQGFITMQKLIDSFLIERTIEDYNQFPIKVNVTDEAIRTERLVFQPRSESVLHPFPVKEFETDQFFEFTSGILPLIFVFVYIMPISQIIAVITLEKESRSREMMNLMGVSDFKIISAWYLTYIILFLFVALFVTIISGGLFPSTAEANGGFPLPIFFLFFAYGLCTLSMAFVVSTLFTKSFNAVVFGLMFYVVLFFIYFEFQERTEIKAGPLLIPQIAFSLSIETFGRLEAIGTGISGDLVSTDILGFNVLRGTLWLYLDAFLYTVFGFYLNAVFPRRFGSPLPFYFPFQPSFWQNQYNSWFQKENTTTVEDRNLEVVTGDSFEEVAETFQQQVRDGVGIQIRGMSKNFKTPNGTKTAVDDLNMDVFEGQILVLLGHNGAGKTTSLQMLTGSLQMSSGEAYIYGHRVKTSLKDIRRNLGFCPQHDLLYKELTVYEHLKFYGMVKGVHGQRLKDEINKSLREVGLIDKVNVRSSGLSGGMKRKLSLAISLVGGSKVILVDEPTSGVDTFSRRSMWEILQTAREGRVIILTTHFMDEADLLGDRIAIMSEGKLQCIGSNLYLKELYGAGYRLVLQKKTDDADITGVEALVKGHVPAAIKASNVGTELSFNLPLSQSATFSPLFTEIDERLMDEAFPITSYGISVTTMEEVFLKAGQSEDLLGGAKTIEGENKNEVAGVGVANLDEDFNILYESNMFLAFLQQFLAMFIKRLNYTRRDSFSCICNTLVPVSILSVGLFISTLLAALGEFPALRLDANELNPDFSNNRQNFMPIVELTGSDEILDINLGRFAQSGNFPQFNNLERAVEEFSNDTGLNRVVFGILYDASDLTDSLTRIGLDTAEALIFPEADFEEQIQNRNGASCFASSIIFFDGTNYNYEIGYNATANYIAPLMVSELDSALLRRSLIEYFDFDDAVFSELSVEFNDNSDSFAGNEGIDFANFSVKFKFPNEADAPRITVTTHPLPLPPSTTQFIDATIGFLTAIFTLLAFSFVPGPVISYVVMEKEESVQIKHLQFVSGAGILPYWLSNYAFDLMVFLIPFSLALLLLFFFNIEAFIDDGAFGAMALVFLGFGFAVIPFAYLVGFLFKKNTSALTWIILINTLAGLVLMIASFVMSFIESTEDINKTLKYVYRLFPSFCLGDSLLQISINSLLRSIENSGISDESLGEIPGLYDLEVVGANLIYLAVTGVVYFGIVLVIEYTQTQAALSQKISCTKDPLDQHTHTIDEDVARETERVEANYKKILGEEVVEDGEGRDVLEMVNLRKVYGNGKVAVRNVSLGIPEGECFGYLGVNGAGKTTTMKCLTADIFPTSGVGYINGYNITTEQWKIRKHIGYCSQFSSILGLLTVKEHLYLFCRIKQVIDVAGTVNSLINRLSLAPFANNLAKNLSGGNKRKLSVAIAMIGSPSVMLLDEPSTGMDVASRRFMWNVISNMVAGKYTGRKTSVVLTTHSMEECEALCSRVGIMVDGSLRCLGSVQHLKTRFGKGYTIEAKLAAISKRDVSEALANSGNNENAIVFVHDVNPILETINALNVGDRLHGQGALIRTRIETEGVGIRFFLSWVIQQQRIIALEEFLSQSFEGVELVEAQDFRLTYRVAKNAETRLSNLFEALETNKQELRLSQYAVSQTTLEQIFNGFATQQASQQPVEEIPVAEAVAN